MIEKENNGNIATEQVVDNENVAFVGKKIESTLMQEPDKNKALKKKKKKKKNKKQEKKKETKILTEFEKKKKRQKGFCNFVSAIVWLVGLFLFTLCCSNLYQQLFNPTGYTGFFGIGEAVVVSNSMEPKINVDDLIFYREIDTSEIVKGDVVVYQKKNGNDETILVVHEVIQIGDGYAITKGINNEIADDAIETSDIVGKYIFKVPGIGVVLSLFSTIWAPIIIAAIFTLIFIIRLIIYFAKRKKTIKHISSNVETREAINYFFDI
jgi:signal peptidase